MKAAISLAALLTTLAVTSVSAQQSQAPMQSAIGVPEKCRSASQASAQGDMMQQMQNMQGMMGQMTETQKGLHEAMMRMNGPMMMGMMAKDADVGWICSMIPHHQGAIDMARAGLRGADNEESKKLAQKTIEENEKSLKELVAWVEKNAQQESRDEATGSTK